MGEGPHRQPCPQGKEGSRGPARERHDGRHAPDEQRHDWRQCLRRGDESRRHGWPWQHVHGRYGWHGRSGRRRGQVLEIRGKAGHDPALDFTPRPDNSYRYRVRIVVFNPNHNRDDVSQGINTKATELFGPWSEPTDEVNMPADVSAFAMGTLPAARSDVKVNFQVVRFEEQNGVTIPRKFAASPGEVIGEVSRR